MQTATMLVQEAATPAGTARSSVLTLISSAVGAGVLSFPYALRCTGWAAGLVAVLLIASLEAFTLYVLTKCAEFTRAKSYSELVNQMLGRAGSLLMIVVTFLYCFGSCIAYLIIVGDSFHPLLEEAFGSAWWTGRTAVILGVGCSVILPLCFRQKLGALTAVSSLCIYGLMAVTACIVIRSAQIVSSDGYSYDDVRAFNPSLSFLTALPIIVFGFQCHTNVITVWQELEPRPTFFRPASRSGLSSPTTGASGEGPPLQLVAGPPLQEQQECQQEAVGSSPAPPWGNGQRRPKSEKLVGMAQVVAVAVGTTAVFYSLVGVAGYLAFPSSVHSNIMLNFSPTDPLIQVARAMVGLIQIAAYPINHHPARGAVRDMLQQTTGRCPSGTGFLATETLLFFGSTLGIALAVDDLGNIFKLVGGTCGSLLILAFPGALLVQYSRGKQRQQQQQWQQAQGGLQEALLMSAAEAGVTGRAVPPYRLWCSKYFWSGVVLLLLSVILCTLTVITTAHPGPFSPA